MVNSRGYSDLQSKGGIKTAAMKKLFPVVPAKSAITIEPIMPEVFELFNEYWVTFFQQNQLLDRQFIFGPGTLDEEFQEKLPLLNRLGVLVR
jgi:hypothetical protein